LFLKEKEMGKGRLVLALAAGLPLLGEVDAALVARFDGSQIAEKDGLVERWINRGEGGDAAAPEAVGQKPSVVSASMPNGTTCRVVDFDGVNDSLEIASDPARYDGGAFTWFVVLKPDTVDPVQGVLRSAYTNAMSNADLMWGDFTKGGLLFSHARKPGGGFVARTSRVEAGRWQLVVGTWGSGLLRQWLDGVYSGGTAKGADVHPSGHLRTRIGANSKSDAGDFFDGQIAEIRIYNDNMVSSNNARRKEIEAELMRKYFSNGAERKPFDPGSGFERSTLFKRPGDMDHYRVPRLVQLPNGDILASASLKLGNMRDAGGKEELRFRISHDDGKTWTDAEGYRMATVVDGQNSRLWSIGHHWPDKNTEGKPMTESWMIEHAKEALPLGAGVSVYSSDASGTNWVSRDVTRQFYIYPGKGIANFIGHGIQLKKGSHAGRLLMPGRCYGTKWERVGPDARNVVVYSDDHGKSWQWGGMSQGYCGEGCIVELSDGSVYLNNRNHDPETAGHRSWSVSRDGGKTFTEFGVADDLPSARCHASIARYSFPDEAAGIPGRVLFLNPAVGIPGRSLAPHEGRRNMTVKLSYDDCRTWPVSQILEPGKVGYSDMIVTQDGTILCVFETGADIYAEDIALVRFKVGALEKKK
jgi:sialidase-1